jgi:hypothetical protein
MTEQIPPVTASYAVKVGDFGDAMMMSLAREIAMDIRPLEEILDSLGIGTARYDEIQTSPTFQRYLRSAVEEWSSATNAAERVKLKSLTMVEQALPEFYARMHDQKESLAAKTELLKAIARFANVGNAAAGVAGSGEKLVVNINLGADRKLRFERDVTPQVIDHEDVEDRL